MATLTADGRRPEGPAWYRRVRSPARSGSTWSRSSPSRPGRAGQRPAARPGRDARRPEARVRPLPRRLLGRGRRAGQRLPLEDRPSATWPSGRGHWNLWGYRSTHGLGYHEYLQMCEDLGAEPLFVINCGMAHTRTACPWTRWAEWVQDALDAIEYANGPADSTWGALPRQGRPPGPLQPEVHGDRQRERRPGLRGALRPVLRRHQGQVSRRCTWWPTSPVTTAGPWTSSTSTTTPAPSSSCATPARYDAYDRKTARRSMSANTPSPQGCGQGNLRAAVGEAAFMTGMERNSDIVVMASYAPLFVNVQLTAVEPRRRSTSTARGSTARPPTTCRRCSARTAATWCCRLDFDGRPMASGRRRRRHRRRHLATQAEFKDIKVTRGDKVLFAGRFRRRHRGLETARRPLAGQGRRPAADRAGENVPRHRRRQVWNDYTYTPQGPQARRGRRLPDPVPRAGRRRQGLVEPRRLGQRAARPGACDGVIRAAAACPAASRPAAGTTSASSSAASRSAATSTAS